MATTNEVEHLRRQRVHEWCGRNLFAVALTGIAVAVSIALFLVFRNVIVQVGRVQALLPICLGLVLAVPFLLIADRIICQYRHREDADDDQ